MDHQLPLEPKGVIGGEFQTVCTTSVRTSQSRRLTPSTPTTSDFQVPTIGFLIDAGLMGMAGAIEAWAKSGFGKVAPAAVSLTHVHFDHV
jgi:glyoxylase-like metal-dependent hydrolase (beta-lactamase superfamily II)